MTNRRSFEKPYVIVDPVLACPECGYSLAGLPAEEQQCPECGRVLSTSDRSTSQQFPPLLQAAREWCRWPWWAGIVLILFAIVAAFHVIAAILMLVVGAVFLGTCLRVAFDLVAEAFAPFEVRHGSRRREQLAQLGLAAVILVGWMVTVLTVSAVAFSAARGLFLLAGLTGPVVRL